jgi:NDP-sugar pyrophosphorylase family protein
MKTIILAGGFGSRLKSVIADVPKPMAPVNGRPFLELLLQKLRCCGMTDIILSVGYKMEVIRDHFTDGVPSGMSLSYSEEASPLGTGGALKAAMVRYPDDCYLVLNGDSLFDCDLLELIRYHRSKRAAITMALAHVEDIGRYGSVVTAPDGAIARFTEKSGSGPGTINAGVYVIEGGVMSSIPGEVFSFEKDVLLASVGKGLFGLRQEGFFIDIGVPADYRYCCEKFSGINRFAPNGSTDAPCPAER